MTTIDICILVILAVGLITGISKGFIKQACAMIGLIAGLLVARALFGAVGEELAPHIGTSVSIARIISFIVIWAVVPLVLMLAGSALTKALEAVHLGFVNRLLGGVAGVAVYLLLLGLAVRVLEFADPENKLISRQTKQESVFYYPMGEVTGIFFPAIKEVTNQIIK